MSLLDEVHLACVLGAPAQAWLSIAADVSLTSDPARVARVRSELQRICSDVWVRPMSAAEHARVVERFERLGHFAIQDARRYPFEADARVPVAGECNALFASCAPTLLAGARFGALRRLRVTVDEGQSVPEFAAFLAGDARGDGGGSEIWRTARERGASAASTAMRAARALMIRWLQERGAPLAKPTVDALTHRIDIDGFSTIKVSIDGESLGLSIAMAALSSMLDLPVPGNVAFTGALRQDGTLAPVGDLPLKLEAAEGHGCTRMILPRTNEAQVSSTASIELRGVPDLASAAVDVWGQEALDKAIRSRVPARATPSASRARLDDLLRTRDGERGPRSVLVSFVARSDPYGTPRGVVEPGPIIKLVREVDPAHAVLLYVPSDDEPEIGRRAEQVQEEIQRTSQCTVDLVETDISDVQSYLELYGRVGSALARVLAKHPDATLVINLSSGTPAMQAVWLLHYYTGPDAARILPIQVREWRHREYGIFHCPPTPAELASMQRTHEGSLVAP